MEQQNTERLSIEAIRAYIDADAEECARRKRMYEYYRGRHRIRDRTMDDPTKPNNRLENGYPSLISNAYTGYVFGEPISYTGDEGLLEQLGMTYNYNDEQAENSVLGMDCSICGVGVEILYMDADSEPRFARVDPVGCIDVRDGTLEDNMTALIRYYETQDPVHRTSWRTVEVYDAVSLRTYRDDNGALTLVEETPHAFGDVPAVVYKNNTDGRGDFEGVISLIDAYDLMQSESINDQEYFSDAYLMLKGLTGTEPNDVADMKKNRVLLIPSDADAAWLIKQQSDALVENIKTRLNNDIHRFSGCPDMSDQNFAGNASGVAIRYKLLQYENIAGVKEREFKRGLQRRIELLCNIWRVLARGSYDWRNVQISFKRSLPQNLLEISQTLANLSDIVSDETKRTMLPIDIDEETEKARLEAEREAGASLFGAQFGELVTDGDE